jgi:DNA transformation protein
MKRVDGFVEFVLDQLSELEQLTAQPMFGGTGLYAGEIFFGIVFFDILYLKVNESTRKHYERAGMKPFKPYDDRPVTLQYYEVPVAVLEDAEELTKWARRAINAAHQKQNASKKRI